MTKAQEESLRPRNPWVIDGRGKTGAEVEVMERLAMEMRQQYKKPRGNVISLDSYRRKR